MTEPFARETTAHAVIRVTHTVHGDGSQYGHVNARLWLPSLEREGTLYESTPIGISAQRDQRDTGWYAVRLGILPVFNHALNAAECERGAKVLKRLARAVDRIDDMAGAPAAGFIDLLVRHLKAARITWVWLPHRLMVNNDPISDDVGGWHQVSTLGMSNVHGRLIGLDRRLREKLQATAPAAAA